MFRYAACAALALAGGCSTLTESTQQQVAVQTILDNRPLSGAGCILVNGAGKWFVTTPGRVLIHKHAGALRVDCRKEGVGQADELIGSKAHGNLWGNVLTLGVGYLVDRDTGAGYDYPATLTIEMKKTGAASSSEGPGAGSVVY
ncbi:hypothetical protein ACFDR9_001635 [Janthinobacterium sp. CG_23.3]|uniref:hypothetical protein n=1 Tax=Janthinobacterium sp. CG_23.3 TaxID=3349634 RepID=UPI0038D4EFB4